MAETNLSTWLTVDDTARAIGCSKRTVERLGRAKQLESRLRRQEGTPPVAVYHPDDVARIASERRRAPAPFVLPAVLTSHDQSGNGNGHGRGLLPGNNAIVTPPADDPFRQLCALLVQRIQSPPSPPSPPHGGETLYLDVEQAAAYLNWTPRDLRKAIRTGQVPVWFGERRDWRRWRIRRKDLEQL